LPDDPQGVPAAAYRERIDGEGQPGTLYSVEWQSSFAAGRRYRMSHDTFRGSAPALQEAAGVRRLMNLLAGGEDGHDDAIDEGTDLQVSKIQIGSTD
jgi:hypothetical protein